MSPSAARLLEEALLAPAPTPIFNQLRDFTQPWMDLNDKTVLVTGGTGCFGKHFIKTVIAQYKPQAADRVLPRRTQAVRHAAGISATRNIPSSATSSAMSATATGWNWR